MIERIHFKAALTVITAFFLAAAFALTPLASRAAWAADARPAAPSVTAYFFHGTYQ